MFVFSEGLSSRECTPYLPLDGYINCLYFRKDWVLESVPHISPLDGAMRFQLNCHSESQVGLRINNKNFLQERRVILLLKLYQCSALIKFYNTSFLKYLGKGEG